MTSAAPQSPRPPTRPGRNARLCAKGGRGQRCVRADQFEKSSPHGGIVGVRIGSGQRRREGGQMRELSEKRRFITEARGQCCFDELRRADWDPEGADPPV